MARRCKVTFDTRLLHHIQTRKDNKAKVLIYKNLVNAYDDYGTLLHYAARYNNDDVARYLLKQGSYVDRLGQGDKTPLMLALKANGHETIQVLLEANANVDVTDAEGNSSLQMFFDQGYVRSKVLRSFWSSLQAKTVVSEELVNKLIAAGCNLFQATYSNNYDVLEFMLKHGIDVNSTNSQGSTALFAAVEMDDLHLVEWFIKKGANIDALGEYGKGTLSIAAYNGSKTMLKFLVKNGANVNAKTGVTEITPLLRTIAHAPNTKDVTDCIEFLLQCGAVPQNPSDRFITIFDYALLSKDANRARYLAAQLALLEKMGVSIEKSAIRVEHPQNQAKLVKIRDYYKTCKSVLETVVFLKLSLCDLLTEIDFKMRIYARHGEFISKIKNSCSKLKRLCPYYYNMLMKRTTKAANLVRLENIAFPIICKILNSNENECYVAARRVLDCLNVHDLEQLVQV